MTRPYHYTNKFLFMLAICNILMIIPTVWSLVIPIKLLLLAKHSAYTISTWMNFVILPTAKWFLILGITTWAFFKRISWVVIFYLLYLSCEVPPFVRAEIQNWRNPITLHFFRPIIELGSTITFYSTILLWLLVLITTIIFLLETDYRDIYNQIRKRFARH